MDYEQTREAFRPNKINILFVGESRPFGETFFYHKNSNLYRYTKESFEKANIAFSLEKFKEYNCWLYDVCKEPINHIRSNSKKLKYSNHCFCYNST